MDDEVLMEEEETSPSNMDENRDGEDIQNAFGGLSIEDDGDYEEASTSTTNEVMFSSPARKTRTPNRAGSYKKRTPGCTPRSPMPTLAPKLSSPSLAELSVSTFSYSLVTNRREDGTKRTHAPHLWIQLVPKGTGSSTSSMWVR
jgi:hypothetical protein